jgi:SAM-dependent methyltransferase
VSTSSTATQRTISHPDIFRCPKCERQLEQNPQGMRCPNCGQVGKWDDMILDFSTEDLYWSYVPRPLANQLVEAAKNEGSEAAVERVLGSLDYKKFLVRMLDGRRGDFRFVLPTSARGCVLDLGAGWGANTLALSLQFQNVVAVDSTKENLRFTSCRIRDSGRSNVRFVCCDPLERGQLPFQKGSFDAVILSGVLEWIGTGSADGSPRELQLRLLRNLRGLLKPEGSVYIGIENRFYALYWVGKPDPHAGVPFLPLLPKKVANLVSQAVKQEPYRNYIYSLRELKELLLEAGYEKVEFYTPIPSYHEPRALFPLRQRTCLPYWFQNLFLPRNFRQGAQAAALRLVNRLNLLPKLTADFAAIAGRDTLPPLTKYLYGHLKERLRSSTGPEELHVMKADGDATGGVSLFVFEQDAAVPTFQAKALRDPRNVAALDREFRTLKSLREKLAGTPLASSIPEPLARFELDGFPFLVTAALHGKPLARSFPRNHAWLSRKRKPAHLLMKAVEWLLAFQGLTRSAPQTIGFSPESLLEGLHKMQLDTPAHRALVKRVAGDDAGTRCLGTMAHGNFAVTNILLNGKGIAVVNWGETCEKSNPLGDLFFLFLSAHVWMEGLSFSQALHALCAPSSSLHDAFRAALARHSRHFQVEFRVIPACLRACVVQRVERAIEARNPGQVAAELQLLSSTFDEEMNLRTELVRVAHGGVPFGPHTEDPNAH